MIARTFLLSLYSITGKKADMRESTKVPEVSHLIPDMLSEKYQQIKHTKRNKRRNKRGKLS